MSFIYRLLISLLFLSFSLFSHAEVMGGSNTYKYYQSSIAPSYCKASFGDMCNTFAGFDTQGCSISGTNCQPVSPGSTDYTFGHTGSCEVTDYYGVKKTETRSWMSYGNQTYFTERSITCAAGGTLKLVGCTATCEPGCPAGTHKENGQCIPDNPCQAKKDQTLELEELCGLRACPAGSTTNSSGSCINSKGAVVPAQAVSSIPSDGQTNSYDGCEVVSLPSPTAAGRGYFRANETGGSELNVYCPVNYKYTGNEGSGSSGSGTGGSGSQPDLVPPKDDTSPPTAPLPTLPPNMYYPPAGGSCNAGDAQGTFGSGDSQQVTCLKQDGNNNGGDGGNNGSGNCLDGTPRPSSGICPTNTDGGGGDNPTPTPCPNNVEKGSDGKCPTATGGTGGEGEGTYGVNEKCTKAPTCTGDVVNCGLIHQQWKSLCDLQESLTGVKDSEASKYNDVGKDSNDPRVAAAVSSLTQKVNDVKGFLVPPSAGSCPADITISLMGKAVVLPISKLCPLFQLMRFLLHLIVNLLSLRILYTSFVRV